MSFANPYNFVSIEEDNVKREKNWLSHERLGEYNGEIKCRILFKSNFIVAGGVNNEREKKFLKINGKPVIQGSTLKGIIRSTAEAISNSCISMMSDKYKYRFMKGFPQEKSSSSDVEYKKIREKGKEWLEFDHMSLVDKKALIETCDSRNGLCICCRLFGTTAKEDKTTEESFTFKGKCRFIDASYLGIYRNDKQIDKNGLPFMTKYLKDHSLSNPKNHHEGFYLNRNKIKGRKFYYHHKDDKLLHYKEYETLPVELVKKNAVFEFTVSFENLTREEYGLLLTTLELEPGLGHKIGMGKPLGLGSCVIEVTEIKEYSKNRYLSMDNINAVTLYKDDSINKRKNEVKRWWTKGIPGDLKCILKLDNGFTEIRYPKKDIRNPANDEFKMFKKLHPPCREFSDDDKNGFSSPSTGKTESLKRLDRARQKDSSIMAEAFKKAKRK
ncbi:MAG: RAMP superfamily CRISPR-associated protein [Thermodesulfovibrionales bacterium]